MKAKVTREAFKVGVDEISVQVEHEGTTYSGCLTEVL